MLRLIALLALAALPAAAQAATLVIRAEGIATADGMVYAGICDRSFDEATCPYRARAQARAGTVELRVRNVKPGAYAIAVFHDRNGNGKLDRSLIGLPSEPYGFSNNVGRVGLPDFQAALITVGAATSAITVPVR